MHRATWLIAMIACGCGGTSSVPPGPARAPASSDGEILAREPCPVPAGPEAFAAEMEAYFVEDLEQAGLAMELAAQPIATILPVAKYDGLVAASQEGRCERVVYRSGALRVVGFAVRPATPGPHAVIIWLRGGNRDYGKNGTQALVTMLDLADAGFVVVATQYREADGGEGKDEFGGADVADVHALVPLARRLPDADASRVYLIGGSRGAMEGLIAIREGLAVRAAAFRGGLYDLRDALAHRPELEEGWGEMIPGWATDRDAAMAHRSAVAWPDPIRVPTLLLHGRQDWRASLEQAEAFAARLRAAGTEHELVIYERDEHQLVLHRAAWIARVVTWFRAH